MKNGRIGRSLTEIGINTIRVEGDSFSTMRIDHFAGAFASKRPHTQAAYGYE
jgi:hypothetical protein